MPRGEGEQSAAPIRTDYACSCDYARCRVSPEVHQSQVPASSLRRNVPFSPSIRAGHVPHGIIERNAKLLYDPMGRVRVTVDAPEAVHDVDAGHSPYGVVCEQTTVEGSVLEPSSLTIAYHVGQLFGPIWVPRRGQEGSPI